MTYQVPVFISDPIWCEIIYSHSVTDPSGGAVVSFNSDALSREFTFDYAADLDLCGTSSIIYMVTMHGTVGNVVPKTNSAQF